MRSCYKYFLLGLLVWTYACANNTQDDLEPVIPDTQQEDLVTFEEVRFVFDNVCSACHSNPPQNGAPMALTNYDLVREAVINRGLLDRISRPDGADGAMPLGGPRLPQETIDLILQWNEDGLLEN